MRRSGTAIALASAIAFGSIAAAPLRALPPAPPAPRGQIADLAGLLEPERAARLEALLARVRAGGGPDLRLLTLPTLDGQDLEDFSVRVARGWGIGHPGQDDGLLLVVVRDDRRLRLEVGYGLEATLTDLQAARLLDQVMAPRLRAGAPGEAIEAGVGAVLARLGVEAPAPPAAAGSAGPAPAVKVAIVVFLGALLLLITLRLICAPGLAPWFVFPLFVLPFWTLPALAAAAAARARLALALAAAVGVAFVAARIWIRATRAGRVWATRSRLGHALGADRASEKPAPVESERTRWRDSGWSTSSSSSGGDFGGGGASSRW